MLPRCAVSFLVRDSNRYSAAAEVPDAEYRRSSRPVRSVMGRAGSSMMRKGQTVGRS